MITGELSVEAIRRLLAKSGAERIADSASEELRRVLEEIGVNIGRKAILLATHARRRTVKAQDIRLAFRSVIKDR